MKENEVPEKLYVNFHFIETHPGSHQPLVTKQGINKYDIEYTRTDAFIKKVCEWIMNHFSSEGFGSPLYYKGLLYRPEDIVEDFKKDMNQ